jgi:hypothetical protein
MLTGQVADVDGAMRLYRAEQDSGRGVDALLDLVRGEEKLISATLGPNQAKAFLDRVVQIFQAG